MNKISLRNKWVFITGASSGIGKELSRCFAEQGANLVLAALDRERESLESWGKELQESCAVEVLTLTGDLAGPEGPEGVYRQVRELVPRIDVLVNNAGTMAFGLFHELPLLDQERVLAVNLRAYMVLMRLFIPDMLADNKPGHIFNVSSVSAFVPTPRHAIYGATKAFVQSMSEAVQQELKGTGLTVFTLNPGYTDTPLLRGGGFPEKLRFYSFGGKSSPALIAEKGVRAFMKGKRVYIPEPHLWFLFCVLNRFTPRRVLNAISELMLRGV